MIGVWMMQPGDDKIVARRLREVLLGMTQDRPLPAARPRINEQTHVRLQRDAGHAAPRAGAGRVRSVRRLASEGPAHRPAHAARRRARRSACPACFPAASSKPSTSAPSSIAASRQAVREMVARHELAHRRHAPQRRLGPLLRQDVVGIKVNPSGTPHRHADRAAARSDPLAERGRCGDKNIIVYDRNSNQLEVNGYHALVPPGVRVVGLDQEWTANGETRGGYDPRSSARWIALASARRVRISRAHLDGSDQDRQPAGDEGTQRVGRDGLPEEPRLRLVQQRRAHARAPRRSPTPSSR